MTPDPIEAVARAIRDVKGGLNYDYMDFCRDAARAAIAAMPKVEAGEVAGLSARIAELEADGARMREALAPFAAMGRLMLHRSWPADQTRDNLNGGGGLQGKVTIGDYCRAYRSLNPETKP